jgi:hypothetical protein
MKLRKFAGILVLCVLMFAHAQAQTPMDSKVLKGLSPVTVLLKTDSGKAALAANYTVTGGIQTGSLSQPTLLPFPLQQQQALRDAFIGSNNLSQLADGLGTTLGSAYVARFHNIDEYKTSKLPESIAEVIGYANAVTAKASSSSPTRLPKARRLCRLTLLQSSKRSAGPRISLARLMDSLPEVPEPMLTATRGHSRQSRP